MTKHSPIGSYSIDLHTNPNTILVTEEEEARRGHLLALGLKLKRDKAYTDRWVTQWGTKTDLGLYRIIASFVLDGE